MGVGVAGVAYLKRRGRRLWAERDPFGKYRDRIQSFGGRFRAASHGYREGHDVWRDSHPFIRLANGIESTLADSRARATALGEAAKGVVDLIRTSAQGPLG